MTVLQRFASWSLVVALVSIAACGGSAPTDARRPSQLGSSDPIAATITLSVSDSSAIEVGRARQAAATVRDPEGNELLGQTVEWSSDNASIATISTSGTITAMAPGGTAVHARLGNIQSALSVTVIPRETAIELTVTGLPSGVSTWIRIAQPLVGQPGRRDSMRIDAAHPTARFVGVLAGPIFGSADQVEFEGGRYAVIGPFVATAKEGETVRPIMDAYVDGDMTSIQGELRYYEMVKVVIPTRMASPGSVGGSISHLAALLSPTVNKSPFQLQKDSTSFASDTLNTFYSVWAPLGPYRVTGIDWSTIFSNGQYMKGWTPSYYAQPISLTRGGSVAPTIFYSPVK